MACGCCRTVPPSPGPCRGLSARLERRADGSWVVSQAPGQAGGGALGGPDGQRPCPAWPGAARAREAPARPRAHTRAAHDLALLSGRRRGRGVPRDSPPGLWWTRRPESAPEPGPLAPRVFVTPQRHAAGRAPASQRERGGTLGGQPPSGGAPSVGASAPVLPSGASGWTPRPSVHNPLAGRARAVRSGRATARPR
jgi:hypothetical protein